MAAELELRHLVREYGRETVVSDVSFEVQRGELVSLLGPSGCGKTTTLRMIAGFVEPTSGQILLRGKDIEPQPVHRRGIGLVFQSYALFLHLSVANNVAFGLRRHGVPRGDIKSRVHEALAKVELSQYADRMPAQLSGGQQQRVALARVLVLEPSVVLLDEPFSNLDARLRQSMRSELRMLQQRLGFTALFVTHDQDEAMALSDRIAVMDRGRLVQLDAPDDIYHKPASRFVAEFIGRANLFRGTVTGVASAGVEYAVDGGTWVAPPPPPTGGSRAELMLRPDQVQLSVASPSTTTAANTLRGVVVDVEFLGGNCLVTVQSATGARLFAEVSTSAEDWRQFQVGTELEARWEAKSVHVLPPEGDDRGDVRT